MITVGREHDCEIDYWQELQNRKLSTSSQAISQRLLEAKARIIYESAKQKWPQVTDWYEFEQSSTKNSLQTLTGPGPKESSPVKPIYHSTVTCIRSTIRLRMCC